MLAVVWPFGFPTRFADPGGAQARYAQTVRALFPVSTVLPGHTTRPGETVEKQMDIWDDKIYCKCNRIPHSDTWRL